MLQKVYKVHWDQKLKFQIKTGSKFIFLSKYYILEKDPKTNWKKFLDSETWELSNLKKIKVQII